MRAATASELADRIASAIPVYGSISRAHAARLLLQRCGHLEPHQVEQAIIIARCRGQIVPEHGGATLRRGK